MLVQIIVITELAFYRRQYAGGKNVLVSFRVYISIQYYERAKSIRWKTPPHSNATPPRFTVGTTHAGRYRSPDIRHTQTLPPDCHTV
jgi:hypothetical protein